MWGIGPFWWLMSKVQDQTSTHQYHVGKRQQTLRGRNLEENGRQNFEDSSSRGVPKQTTPVPVHVFLSFAEMLKENFQMMLNEWLTAIKLQKYFVSMNMKRVVGCRSALVFAVFLTTVEEKYCSSLGYNE